MYCWWNAYQVLVQLEITKTYIAWFWFYKIWQLSYVHTCAERLRSGDGWILTFPLRYCGYVHTYAMQTQADLPFLGDKDGLERAVSKWTRKIGCWTHLLRSRFCSRSATAYVWTHVMICVEANFPPASVPRMCERTLRHLTWYWKGCLD